MFALTCWYHKSIASKKTKLVNDTRMFRSHECSIGPEALWYTLPDFISVFLADCTISWNLVGRLWVPGIIWGKVALLARVLFSILQEEGVILLPLCTASAVTECGSWRNWWELVEKLINGEEGGKNIMYLSVQETVLRQKGKILSCRVVCFGFFFPRIEVLLTCFSCQKWWKFS